jgi:diguanylate cyclase (GGDEF)-like protein/PAS domain S-box-containing protein
MADSPTSPTRPEQTATPGDLPGQPAALMSEIGTLLVELEDASTATSQLPPVVDSHTDNQLIQVRLGIASSLYAALRLKHPATAGHGLRVALSSSAWAVQMRLPQGQRDAIEVAALLHDIGMIGVPDHILLKPGPLDAKEVRIVEQARAKSLDVLRFACAEPAIFQIVEHVGAWYDGSKAGYRLAGEQIPLGARMITIVEAFDAMTTDHVFRPAMSLERATSELFEFSGTQFDPELIRQFVELQADHQSQSRQEAAGRWLQSLDPETVHSCWQLGAPPSLGSLADADRTFPAMLLDNMHDAVAFVDAGFRIVEWNHGAERLTGITRASVRQRQWLPDLLAMQNEKGDSVSEDDCPVMGAIHSSVQSLRRMTIRGRSGRTVSVDSHAIPVLADDGTVLGAILLLHDASSETSLEQRCQSLHEKATKDPLTQVANRREFDRVHEAFIRTHRQQQVPCSLIICDLDLFKQINDRYGHQAGDEAIKTLARVLKNSCRPGDLAARYGGEEFVILCADCDNASAARRAERIRKTLSQTPHARLEGRCVTASFGVTEIQPGDTPETMLRRADRALLMAKSKGRNRVVQLGVGLGTDTPEQKKGLFWQKPARPPVVLERDLLTPVPIALAIEKLRGFVADHQAKIHAIDGNHVRLEIDDRAGQTRRRGDRPVTFLVDLRFEEERFSNSDAEEAGAGAISRTRIHLTITPRKNRDRRRDDVGNRANEVLASFRSYLMATLDNAPAGKGVLGRAKRILAPWLAKR